MSEKRFTMYKNDYTLIDNLTGHICEFPNQKYAETCCKWSNELWGENEQLKKRNKFLEEFDGRAKTVANLKAENEQLKKDDLLFFQQVFGILMKYQHLFNREMADDVLEDLGIELTEWFE